MNENSFFSSDRVFKLWDYSIGHSRLLIRSPMISGYDENIDIVFGSVDYLQLGVSFDGIRIRKIINFDSHLEVTLRKKLLHMSYLFEIESGGEYHYVTANIVNVYKNKLDFGDSMLMLSEDTSSELIWSSRDL